MDGGNQVLARELARYALINESRRRPLKRDEVAKSGLLGPRNRQFLQLLEQCNDQLGSVFGMELVEMRARGRNAEQVLLAREIVLQASQLHPAQPPETAATQAKLGPAKGASGSTKQYILRSKLDPEIINKINKIVDAELHQGSPVQHDNGAIIDWRRGDELGLIGVLGLILSLILVSGRQLDNERLLAYLRRLNVHETCKLPHSPAAVRPPANLDALLSLFNKQGYLECIEPGTRGGVGMAGQAKLRRQSQAIHRDTARNLAWQWGARAEIEFGEKQIATFVSEIYRAGDDEAQVQDTQETSATRRPKVKHDQIINDIEKVAGSRLQDSSSFGQVLDETQG